MPVSKEVRSRGLLAAESGDDGDDSPESLQALFPAAVYAFPVSPARSVELPMAAVNALPTEQK